MPSTPVEYAGEHVACHATDINEHAAPDAGTKRSLPRRSGMVGLTIRWRLHASAGVTQHYKAETHFLTARLRPLKLHHWSTPARAALRGWIPPVIRRRRGRNAEVADYRSLGVTLRQRQSRPHHGGSDA